MTYLFHGGGKLTGTSRSELQDTSSSQPDTPNATPKILTNTAQ